MRNQLKLFENGKGLERKIHVSDLDCEKIFPVHLLKEDEPTPEENERLQGIVDEIMLQKQDDECVANYGARQMKQKYQNFLADPRMKGISLSIYEQPELKMKLLQAYFPRQFSVEKQDLRQRTIPKIGKAFNALYTYARGH